jgi:hypothetical protein
MKKLTEIFGWTILKEEAINKCLKIKIFDVKSVFKLSDFKL